MPKRPTIKTLMLAGLMSMATAASQAQTPTPIRPEQPAISMDEARRIAIDNGVVRIEEIELDDGTWEIDGRDSAGAEIEVDLRASDGMVIRIDRDRPAAAEIRP